MSSFLRNSQRMLEINNNSIPQNVVLYCKIVLHRYIRLTPLFITSIIVAKITATLLVDISVYEIFFRDDLVCPKLVFFEKYVFLSQLYIFRYWWRNLLYIHNLYPKEEICINWSWSLGCDMQFFALATVVLFIYAK